MQFPIELPPKFLALAEELHINPEDIEEHFTKGGGPGGQKINKTNSCVELHYAPLNINVRVQRHREQGANRTSAYKSLISKIEDKIKGKASARAQKAFKVRKQKHRRSRRAKERMLEEKLRNLLFVSSFRNKYKATTDKVPNKAEVKLTVNSAERWLKIELKI